MYVEVSPAVEKPKSGGKFSAQGCTASMTGSVVGQQDYMDISTPVIN